MAVVAVSPFALQAGSIQKFTGPSKGAFPTFSMFINAERLNSPAEKILKLGSTFKGKEEHNNYLRKTKSRSIR